jgi:hypothetical protein
MFAALLAAACASHSFAQDAQSQRNVLRLIPPDADVAVVIPNLKVCSDEMTQWLEGMERAQMLLGTRPIDQLKSATGLNVGVDDLGGLAIVLPQQAAKLQPMFLVPVTDGKAFLEGNFKSHDGNLYTRADGMTLYARDLGSHVLLTDSPTADDFRSDGNFASNLDELFGERGRELLSSSELFVYAKGAALEGLANAGGQKFSDMGWGDLPILQNVEFSVTAIDFDPLALVVRGLGKMNPVYPLARAAVGGDGRGCDLSELPDKPFYWATALDVQGLGGQAVMEDFAAMLHWPTLPGWLGDARTIRFAAYPSPAGLSGGLLNDAVAVLETDAPAQVIDAIKRHVLAADQAIAGVTRAGTWEETRDVKGVGTASAYEITSVDVPPEQAQWQMLEQMIFGRAGCRGFVKATDDTVIVTFSQRPAVLEAALAAARGESKNLEQSAMLCTMRQWMPLQRDVEGYVGVGRLAALAQQVALSFGMNDHIPHIDPASPPVGFALSVHEQTVESSLIVPAPLCAVAFDLVMKQAGRAAVEPSPNALPIPSTNPSSGEGP